jgi:proteic killer suppression protein
MIRSWGNGATRRFAEVGKSKFSGMNVDVAEKRLAALEAATSLADLTPLRAIGLHKLAGARNDQWAVSVNGPWRICFRFKDGDVWDVEIVDYH